jgi:hypothetical protein
MKLQKREESKIRPRRPPEKGDLSKISRRARVIYTSDVLFEVKFGGNDRYKFRKEDAEVYVKPCPNANVRCMYRGNNRETFPWKVYTLFNELIYEEKGNNLEKKTSN